MMWRGMASMLFAFGVDQLTKYLAMSQLTMLSPEGIAVLPVLNLRLGYNTGVSFGIFAESAAGAAWLLVTVKIVIVSALFIWLWRTNSAIESVSLGAIIGGALGNTVDRIRHGAVVDFIDAHAAGWHWPTFNMADVSIVLGVTGFLLAGPIGNERHLHAAPGNEKRKSP